MFFNINLLFNGNCQEAFEFYHQILGGEALNPTITYGEIDPEISDELKDKIYYTELSFGDFTLRGQDEALSGSFLDRTNTIINLDFDSSLVGEALYQDLSDGGTIIEPLDTLIDGVQYSKFIDKFGITWEILIHL